MAAAETGTQQEIKHEGGRPGSDFMVDVIKTLDIKYLPCNPASSFRALHESLIDYGANKSPEFLTCMHEESAVGMAHGYFKIAGKQLNCLTHANVYGDDRQNATNYPIARLTSSSGDVHYLRTRDFSTMGIATGSAIVTAVVQVPSNIPPGSWNLEVVANGIASAPTPVGVGTRDCFLVMDRSTAGQGEVKALIFLNGTTAVIDHAILVVVEGYTASELGLTASNLGSPPIVPTFAPPLTGVHVVQRGVVLPEDASVPPNVPQRFTFPFALQFDDDSMFNFTGPFQDITVTAVLTAAGQTVANAGLLRLLKSPDPYILDGDPGRGVDWWTSIDIRVLQVV